MNDRQQQNHRHVTNIIKCVPLVVTGEGCLRKIIPFTAPMTTAPTTPSTTFPWRRPPPPPPPRSARAANQCPSGEWVENSGSCYLFDPNNRIYSEARIFCEGVPGANLVKIDDSTENDFLKNYAANVATPEPTTGYWIGLQNFNGVETWVPSFAQANFFDWFNQPVVGQSCGAMWRVYAYQWVDIECTVSNGEGDSDGRTLFSLCEFELPTAG